MLPILLAAVEGHGIHRLNDGEAMFISYPCIHGGYEAEEKHDSRSSLMVEQVVRLPPSIKADSGLRCEITKLTTDHVPYALDRFPRADVCQGATPRPPSIFQEFTGRLEAIHQPVYTNVYSFLVYEYCAR